MNNKKYLKVFYIIMFLGITSFIIYVLISRNIINFKDDEKPESISINQEYMGLKVNEKYQLSYFIEPESKNNQQVIYESDNEKVVYVNSITGYLETKSEGEATIKVRLKDYNDIYDTCKIYVSNKNVGINKIIIKNENIDLNLGNSYQIKYQIEPKNATMHEIEYISSDENIISVNAKGIIIANNIGNAKVTILDKISNHSVNIKVNVKEANKGSDKKEETKKEETIIDEKVENIEDIELSTSSMELKVGEVKTIFAKLIPEVNKKITWTSSDESIVIVDQNGNVKGIKNGVATINIKVDDIRKSVFIKVGEEETKNVTKFIAVFDGNNISCETEGKSCIVKAPNIEKSGYEILGWSSKSNAKEEEVKVGEEITLTKNIEYYKVVRKKLTGSFVAGSNTKISKASETCYIYNNDKSCNIKTPSIEGTNGYVALGFNTNKNATVASIKGNETISINKDVTYYSIAGKRNYLTATFRVQDANAIKESSKEVTCEIKSGNSCDIEIPSFTAKEGYAIVGWNTDKNAKESIINGTKITINSDVTYYSITKTKTPLTATFTIQNNTATKTDTNTTCEVYNGEKSCSITVPLLTAKEGYTVIGWNTDKNATVEKLKGGEKINIDKNITYYSITKSSKKLTATFSVLTPKIVKAASSTVSCDLYNGNSSCMIVTPSLTKLTSTVTPLGWNTDKSATKATISEGKSVTITKDTTYYSMVSEVITITFNVGEMVSGKNVKADKLSYSYIDKNGKTIVKEEGQSLKTTCISYNGKGCKTDYVPTIYSRGNYIMGYSKTVDGKTIGIWKTTFKSDTTLYARVGYDDTTRVKNISMSHEILYGNVILEIESGLSTSAYNSFKTFIDKVYKYFPELFFYNGKIIFLNRNTYNSVLKPMYSDINNTAGIAFSESDFHNVYFWYTTNNYFHTAIHEITHAVNYFYQRSFGTYMSRTDELKKIFNVSSSSKPRPLSSNAYLNPTARTEFVSEAMAETIRVLIYGKEGKYPYKSEGSLNDSIKNLMVKYLNNMHNYLKNKGLIMSK